MDTGMLCLTRKTAYLLVSELREVCRCLWSSDFFFAQIGGLPRF
uniref:Uncharacterized protein n=1 Tax=Arundo donax TaxID=35708 RepID=A0A0A9A0U4_ARUDO